MVQLNTEVVGYISGAITALCGLGLAALRGRDRELHRQAILKAITPEQVSALDKLLPMLFRGAGFLVVLIGACLNASAPVMAARENAANADVLVRAARQSSGCTALAPDYTPDRRPIALPIYEAQR